MPNNRRLPRNVRSVDPSMIPGFIGESRYASLGARVPTVPPLEQPPAPKHFPAPYVPLDGDLFFEVFMFFFPSICTCLQLVHLYHTNWWMPNSHSTHAVNFHLIDTNLVTFVTVLLSRRLVYLIGNRVMDILLPPRFQEVAASIFRIVLSVILFILLTICAYRVAQKSLFMNIFYLCYPISVYFVLFGFNPAPFFELVNLVPDSMPPLHACSSVAVDIRQEVERLKSNFNNRLKQIIFSSVINAYYAGFVPCCFAQTYIHYNVYWATQHTAFIFLSSFIGYCYQVLHPRYCDILHRSALHLGSWDKMETRNMLLVNNKWNEETLWPHGILVRHGKDVYRAQGECNSSEPGSTASSKFYALFKDPSCILRHLLIVHGLYVAWQVYFIFITRFWHDMMSLNFVMFFNYYYLYKLIRDYRVSSYLYQQERLMHEKSRCR